MVLYALGIVMPSPPRMDSPGFLVTGCIRSIAVMLVGGAMYLLGFWSVGRTILAVSLLAAIAFAASIYESRSEGPLGLGAVAAISLLVGAVLIAASWGTPNWIPSTITALSVSLVVIFSRRWIQKAP